MDTEKSILQLYPLPGGTVPLKGLYLQQNLHQRERSAGPFVYTNFISSLDGRIAVSHANRCDLVMPEGITNPRDWRLFQELAAQADVLISSGRYMRQYTSDHAQDILSVYDDPSFGDLRAWRRLQGMSEHPAVAILSPKLEFSLPDSLAYSGRPVLVYTSTAADPARVKALEQRNVEVITGADRRIDGATLMHHLTTKGYRSIYSVTGPSVLHTLLTAGVLDRLFVTFTHRLLGGEHFATLVEGPTFDRPVDLELGGFYYDSVAPDGAGQCFAYFDRPKVDTGKA